MTRYLLALVLVPAIATADPKSEAANHKTKAAAAYKDKRWKVVLDELNAAYALDPDPSLYFSIGQVYVKMGRCPDAIIAYEQFLSSKPAADAAQMAREAIAACRAAATVAPDPGPEEPKPVEPTPVEPACSRASKASRASPASRPKRRAAVSATSARACRLVRAVSRGVTARRSSSSSIVINETARFRSHKARV